MFPIWHGESRIVFRKPNFFAAKHLYKQRYWTWLFTPVLETQNFHGPPLQGAMGIVSFDKKVSGFPKAVKQEIIATLGPT